MSVSIDKDIEVSRIGDRDVILQDDDLINSFTPEERARITRKVDIRLIIPVGIIFMVSLMDRTNVGENLTRS